MTRPIATAEYSDTQNDLREFFENHANMAFDLCWDAHCKADYYTKLLANIKSGFVLSDELPEAKGLSTATTKSAIQKLLKQATADSESAWELSGDIAKEFRTTIRSALLEGESVPQYDIEYQTKNTQKSAKIRIKTWRRNIEVELIGSDAALEELHSLITLAALKS